MGLWDFFRKNKKKERVQEADESGMFHLQSENSHEMVEELEEQQIDFDSREESDHFIRNCCDRIIEATREIEEAKVEYGAVTAYLMDMQKIDMIPRKEREDLESAAREIVTLGRERDSFDNTEEIKLPVQVRRTMYKYEKVMVSEIKKMYENEAYQKAIKNDLRYLEGEKGYLKYQRQEIIAKQKYLRNIAITTSVLVVALFILIYALAKVFRADMRFPFILTITMAAVSAAYIYFEANKNRMNMVLTEKKMNKAIGLLNKVKIKYVNNTNYLDYTYEKYGVNSAMELEHIWQQYEQMRQREKQIRSNADKMSANNEKLIAELKKYEVEDPDIWIHQPLAILDKKEMVEIRHRLNVRRQKLRDRIDYNNKVKAETVAKIQALLEQKPECRGEIMGLLRNYQIEV